jgi:hypothetical protein
LTSWMPLPTSALARKEKCDYDQWQVENGTGVDIPRRGLCTSLMSCQCFCVRRHSSGSYGSFPPLLWDSAQ